MEAIKTANSYHEVNSICPLLGWARQHHLNRHLKPMSFINRQWLRDMYTPPNFLVKSNAEFPTTLIVKKPVQIGMTERMLCEMFWRCADGWRGLYVMPTQTIRTGFVQDRLNRLFGYVPFYRQKILEGGEADSVLQKHFGKGTMKFIGSNSANEFIEYPADIAVVDEYDDCKQENLIMVKDRLKASKFKHERYCGRPSYEDVGIDTLYNTTNKFVFMSRCQSCNNYAELDWFGNVVNKIDEYSYEPRKKNNGKIYIECPKCGKPVLQPWRGQWVAEYPDREKIGYGFSRLISADSDFNELYSEFVTAIGNETNMRYFYNGNLGKAYSPKGGRITDEMLKKCEGEHIITSTNESNQVFMGVDPGGRHHVFIYEINPAGKKKIIHVGASFDWSSLAFLLDQYNVTTCVIDGAYDPTKAKELRDEHFDKVWLCLYNDSGSLKQWKLDYEAHQISTDRTQSLDDVLQKVVKKEWLLPKNWKKVSNEELKTHWTKPTRYFDEKRETHIWTKPGAGDHLFHAAGYALMAERLPAGGDWGDAVGSGSER
jgi:hypothetical protein